MENSVIIPSKRIALDNIENGVVWEVRFNAKALVLDKENPFYMYLVAFSNLKPSRNGYSVYMVDKETPTLEENRIFIQRMLKDSNFAKSDKIKYILYKDEETSNPFAVVVENF